MSEEWRSDPMFKQAAEQQPRRPVAPGVSGLIIGFIMLGLLCLVIVAIGALLGVGINLVS